MAPEWTEAAALPDLEKFLSPISAQRPAGENLRYDPLYDEVREARRNEDPDLPQGVWKVEPKRADWPKVEALCQTALESRTKDLQLAGWLTEAWIHRSGFEGAELGLRLLGGLCESFWESLFPALDEEGDLEPRMSLFEWFDRRLSLCVKEVPVTRPETEDGGVFRWLDWESALHRANLEKVRSGTDLEGQVDTSKFMVSTSLTSTVFFQDLENTLGRCRKAVSDLYELLEERCGDEAPRLFQSQETFETIHRFLRGVLRQRMEGEEEEAVPEGSAVEATTMDSDQDTASVFSGGAPIRGRAEAYRRLSEAADYLARTEPHSPTPFLVRRAVSWGSMTVAELLQELLTDNADLPTVFKLLGIPRAQGHR